MEKAVRESASQDTALDADAPAHAPGGGGGGDAAAGPSDGSTAKAAAGPAPHDGGWEADYSLLAAMGIVVGQPKPQAPKAAEGSGGGAAKPAAHKVPGIHTPPKAGPQGKVTPEIKKDLQAKKDHKAAGAAAGGGAGGAGAAAAGPAGGANAQMDAAPKAGAAVAAPAAGAAAAGGDAPTDGTKPPGSHTGDDVDAHNVERLIELLDHDADPEHRRAAARALGKIKSPKARAALEKALRDKDPQVVKAATESLKGALT